MTRSVTHFLILLLYTGCYQLSFASSTDSAFKISVGGIQKSASEVLSQYIQFQSLSCHEKVAGEWLKEICLENGLYVSQFGDQDGNYNIAASLFPLSDKKPNIIFLNHIDVVDAGDTSIWEHPPFSGMVTDNKIWGRGAFDNKGAAIMQLFGILKFKFEQQHSNSEYNVTFLAVSCEETMCDGGIDYVVENHFDELNPISVLGEGATELSELIGSEKDEFVFGISIAHKRPFWIELNLNTINSSHGSVTPKKYSTKEIAIALSKLAKKKTPVIFIDENKEILKSIAENKKGLSKFILKHPVFFKPIVVSQLRKKPEIFALFTNTVTITSIETNNKVINKIPQSTRATLDCRLLPEASEEKFLRFVQRGLKNDDIEVKIIKKLNPLPLSNTENEFYHHLENSIMDSYKNASVFPIILPNYSDVGKFRLKGVQSYSIIPVVMDIECLKCIHAENERLPISALNQGIDVYFNLLNRALN